MNTEQSQSVEEYFAQCYGASEGWDKQLHKYNFYDMTDFAEAWNTKRLHFLEKQIEDLTDCKNGLVDDQQPLYDQYAAMMERVTDLEKENQRLKEKEIRGDRMIVALEHEKMVLKSQIRAYRDYCERNGLGGI
jgi:flagellar capping protein FliD